MEERHQPGVSATAALVVDEAVMIGRAAARDQSTKRQIRITDHLGGLKRGSGFGDVERPTVEQLLQSVANAEVGTP